MLATRQVADKKSAVPEGTALYKQQTSSKTTKQYSIIDATLVSAFNFLVTFYCLNIKIYLIHYYRMT
jgi:hypothetical protein